MKTPTAIIHLEPGAETSWRMTADGGEVGAGAWDTVDVGAGLDQAIRAVHRSGRRCKVVVAKSAQDLSTAVAVASIRRVLDIYEAVDARWPA